MVRGDWGGLYDTRKFHFWAEGAFRCLCGKYGGNSPGTHNESRDDNDWRNCVQCLRKLEKLTTD